ncbi:ABC transporter ATP-binding protein [Tolypothrix sp. FACHB-123]|uniref:ABC transporter ATP-binding protein n=1 Tax=Tolypothrix sp. FACHB-123 TaxID=2692868 RepID=UPI0016821EAC|nr:ABC transporter ATP-binding protein [Tolypothrix sp. FACHB-123]MBD2357548.1 ABC transporter ATP-binding protein [Tolypothrix sp. FACHB-123]
MSDTVIRVENLSKKYIIGHQQQERYTALRDVIANKAKVLISPFYNKTSKMLNSQEEFWALKDVSFEIKQGDRVGIIGRNGAGKSTLLKVLSRITEPTEGSIKIKGRVASLLEVGTGFHPELTGRENIYLNGAILGMSKVEIKRKFDEIVDFAEIAKFLDTPVKRYSSGMYVRLAFAVAAHLEPEILVVDEVLAVGDAQFQKKCLGKMQEVSTQGRTIIFVSHNSSAIANLCDRGLFLEKGNLKANTTSIQALSLYTSELNKFNFVSQTKIDSPSIWKVEIDQNALEKGDLCVKVHFTSPWVLDPPLVGIVVYSIHGIPLFGTNTWLDPDFKPQCLKSGIATLLVKNLPLHSGSYKLSIWLGEKNQNYDSKLDAIAFDFISLDVLPQGLSPDFIGPFKIYGQWHLAPIMENINIVKG